MKIKSYYTKAQNKIYQKGFEDGAIALSKLLDEHPEGWNGPCMCDVCMSYADPE